jgi:hypothetical protein
MMYTADSQDTDQHRAEDDSPVPPSPGWEAFRDATVFTTAAWERD